MDLLHENLLKYCEKKVLAKRLYIRTQKLNEISLNEKRKTGFRVKNEFIERMIENELTYFNYKPSPSNSLDMPSIIK